MTAVRRLAVVEEMAAILSPVIGFWGLALHSRPLAVLGAALMFVAALCNDDRWREGGALVAIFAAAEWAGQKLAKIEEAHEAATNGQSIKARTRSIADLAGCVMTACSEAAALVEAAAILTNSRRPRHPQRTTRRDA